MVLQCLNHNYNDTLATSNTNCTGSSEKCARKVNCPDSDHECFVFFSESNLISAGCYKAHAERKSSEKCPKECIGEPKGGKFYCCCSENLCNTNFRIPSPPLPPPEPAKPVTEITMKHDSAINILWTAIPAVSIVTLMVAYIYKRNKCIRARKSRAAEHNQANPDSSELNEMRNNRDVSITIPLRNACDYLGNNQGDHNRTTTTYLTNHHDANNFRQQQIHHENSNDNIDNRIDLSSVKLMKTIGSGRFGTVHKATLNESDVAVKIISANDYQTWLNERQIYCSPRIRHPNILNFIYSDEHLETESYWLILEYANEGSLYSFLKEKNINWDEFLLISSGIVHGLSHLHDVDIAHRDFKSKNVLLKQGLVPCITDFGVAAILDTANGSQLDHRKKYLQVGTPRYMAPEVLECSVTFTKASFTKIDIYALSLVLWELLSRCHPLPASPDVPVSPYRLPFEEFMSSDPDIDMMRQIVVVNKLRPSLKEQWRIYPVSEVCRAIEDGWEYDYDARISASCFVERVESLPPCDL